MTSVLATPTIKGMFVNSHLATLRKTHGESMVSQLLKRTGLDAPFKPLADVPVATEVVVLENIIDLLAAAPLTDQERSYQAGQLHFHNFQMTPLGKLLFQVLPADFKTVFAKSDVVARHIFSNLTVKVLETSPSSLQITVTNNGYPMEHLQGFFTEWLQYYGKTVTVGAQSINPTTHVYTLSWLQ